MTKVAILGYGVVGAGVGILCREQAETIRRNRGLSLEVKYVLDIRDFPGDPYEDKVTHDPEVIFNDPEVEMVVETIGGVSVAYDYTKRALTAGKHVITSNKELVSAHGLELLQLAAEHKVHYLFEAAVGGGIPLLVTLREHLASNDILEITGILNGTCNYILTQMAQNGQDFDSALTEAQDRGYAERDPSADVDGHDTARKLAILASMVSGEWIDPELISLTGIRNIGVRDIAVAKSLHAKIALLATLRSGERGSDRCMELRVAPTLLPLDDPIAAASDVFNAVLIKAYPVDDVMLYGRGAGSLPTASAVLGDMMEAADRPWTEEQAQLWEPMREGRVIAGGDAKVSAVIRIKKDFSEYELGQYLHDLNGFSMLESPFADEYLIETSNEHLREGRLHSAVSELPEGTLLQVLRTL